MTSPNDDPIGTAISETLQAIAEDPESQDLATFYSRIGRQLADAGRQDANDSHVKRIAEECATAAFDAKTPRSKATELATKEALSRLHRDGLRANEKQIRDAVSDQVNYLLAASRQRRMKRHARCLSSSSGVHGDGTMLKASRRERGLYGVGCRSTPSVDLCPDRRSRYLRRNLRGRAGNASVGPMGPRQAMLYERRSGSPHTFEAVERERAAISPSSVSRRQNTQVRVVAIALEQRPGVADGTIATGRTAELLSYFYATPQELGWKHEPSEY